MEADRPELGLSKIVDPISLKKHEAMLERLSNRHHHSTPRPSAASDSPSFESTQSFLAAFSQRKQSIELALERCRNVSDPGDSKSRLKADLDGISGSISDLEKFVAENSYFLPSYEVRASLKSVADLREALEAANSELQPRKKFSFRNKPAKREAEKKAAADSVANSAQRFDLSALVPSAPPRDSPGLRNASNAVLERDLGSSECGEFTIEELDCCEVRLRGRMRALFVHRLKNCRVYVGPLDGSILIENAVDCVFVLASHQIRIHHVKQTDFYLRVRSRPIIEDCCRVRFAPYRMVYDGIEKDLNDSGLGEENGNWSNVDDFKWLRAAQSPNWCVLPEGEWMDVVNVSGLET